VTDSRSTTRSTRPCSRISLRRSWNYSASRTNREAKQHEDSERDPRGARPVRDPLRRHALALPVVARSNPDHWNIREKWTIGYQALGPFVAPGFMLIFVGLVWILPWLSPRHFKVDAFAELQLRHLHLHRAHGLHPSDHAAGCVAPEAPLARALVAGIFLFFAAMGNVLGKVRRNFWLGVRTPWTLASDAVWVATHRLAARLFVAAGCLGAVAVWLGVPLVLCFVLLMMVVATPAVYSLAMSKRLERASPARAGRCRPPPAPAVVFA